MKAAGEDSEITYGSEGLTTARRLVEKALVKIDFSNE
jgi:hypothetical protein